MRSSSPFRALLVVGLLLVGALASVPTGVAPAAGVVKPDVLVGFNGGLIDTALISANGGTLLASIPSLGIAGIKTADPAAFMAAMRGSVSVSFVETNDPVRAVGTGWDATGWDGTGWDGTGWDGTGWDGTGWDGTGWDGSLWNASFLASKATTNGGGDPLTKYQWGWHTVNAKQAVKIARGEGVDACVLDSGVDYAHPDLAPRMWRDPVTGAYGTDVHNGDADPMDDAGHGTHVAGILGAANRNGLGVAGMGAGRIMAVKVLGADGAGTEMDLAMGIQWCVGKGARVLSMSLSGDQDSPAVHAAVKDAVAKGAVLVAAAGNTGKAGGLRYPAAYPEVIAVAATMPDGRWAPYSTVAGYVDVAAPGWAVVSTYKGGGYAAVNGTSMATAFVSGTASLMLRANASLNATDVKAALARGAVDLGPAGPDPYVGFGFLRADRAVKLAHSR